MLKTVLMGCLGISGVVASAMVTVAQSVPSNIVPDNTLGNERSIVQQSVQEELIRGGAQRGQNLFHSFQELNVGEGRSAYFVTPNASIQNILARVTGGNPSQILGRLGTMQILNGIPTVSNTNLFLINPNGILFGPNARLDIGGSFVATTANAIQFGNLGSFSATQPLTPSPLLTVQPSALLYTQLQSPTTSITHRSTGIDENGLIGTTFGLQVKDGHSLLLVGGDVNLDGGEINSWGGRVELGGLSAPGAIALQIADEKLSLRFPKGVARGEVSLNNDAKVDVALSNGGDIAVSAKTINLAGGSILEAGIAENLGNPGDQSGDIQLDATERLQISGSSTRIRNTVEANGIGNAGNIFISTGVLAISDRARFDTSTAGRGNAGNTIINARNAVTLAQAFIFSNVDTTGNGKGGDIRITTNSLNLLNGAQLIAGVSEKGQGDSGAITINAIDAVTLDNGQIFSDVERNAIGRGGDVTIRTGLLRLTNSGRIIANTAGQGNAGKITIDAETVQFQGSGSNSSQPRSGIRALAFEGAEGSAGDVEITTNLFSMSNGARITTSTETRGNSGNITIKARDRAQLEGAGTTLFSSIESRGNGQGGNIRFDVGSFELLNDAQLTTGIVDGGEGNSGSIIINASDAVILNSGKIFSDVEKNAIGRGGDIQIEANVLSLNNGASLNASTAGQGKAGNITINARQQAIFQGDFTAAFSSVAQGGKGNGGNIEIVTGRLEFLDGGQLVATTDGEGDAGNITLTVRDELLLRGKTSDRAFSSGIATSIGENGRSSGGNITLSSSALSLFDDASIKADTAGIGNAGNVTLTVRDRVLLDNSTISSNVRPDREGTSRQVTGGNIRLSTNVLELLNGGQLGVATFGTGNGGTLTVEADQIKMSGTSPVDRNFLSGMVANVEATGKGTGGNIQVTANSLEITNGSQISAGTRGEGNAGSVTVTVRDRMTLDGAAFDELSSSGINTTSTGRSGNGGDVNISTGSLSILDGASISTIARQGNAGNITIGARDALIVQGVSPNRKLGSAIASFILNNLETVPLSKGGDVRLSAGSLEINNGGKLSTSVFGKGNAGNIVIDVRNRVAFNNGFAQSRVEPNGEGKGGDIRLSANTLEVSNGAELDAGVFSKGEAGNIFLGRDDKPITSILISGVSPLGFSSGIFTDTASNRPAGNIQIIADQFRLLNGAVVNSQTFGDGDSGSISIRASRAEILSGSQILAVTQGSGSAQNITLTADQLLISGSDPTYNQRRAEFHRQVDPISPESGIYTRSLSIENAGSAGNIFLTAPQIRLTNQATIDTQSATTNGGNITIIAPQFLVLRQNSLISATAGTAEAGGNGGNIRINAGLIVAPFKTNASISANAFKGNGGSIQIDTQGIFGFSPPLQPTLETNKITASSQFGISGTVALNKPDIDPSRGLAELPSIPTDPSNQINQSCSPRVQATSSFIRTGRGGIPATPSEPLDEDNAIANWVTLNPQDNQPAKPNSVIPERSTQPVIEAQSWRRDANGNIELIAEASPSIPHFSRSISQCPE